MISEQASFLSPVDMMIVMAVALVVFGPAKLPEVGRQLGQAIRELKKLTSELTDSIHNETSEIKSAFDTVSPYSLKPSPIDSEPKLPEPVEGYSIEGAMSESPMLTTSPESSEKEPSEIVSPGQMEASEIPLAAVAPKSGDEVQ